MPQISPKEIGVTVRELDNAKPGTIRRLLSGRLEVQKPTVGQIVHYYGNPDKGQPFPAIITHVWSNDYVNLKVLPDGSFPLAAKVDMATMDTMPTKVLRGKELGQWDLPKE